ncbi:MAG: metal-dependent transcriptional regulator, partial [Methanocorpusculum sp.]|nr:metal-dependent transcriptional regulator [Methanocorpusculum sp.]
EINKSFSFLKEKGYIVENKNKLSLTEKGEKKAASVARKHAVLESFLTDVLGTKPDEASKQACILEHNISNETINKLDSFLCEQKPEYTDHNKLTEKSPIEPLCECPEGSILHVSMIKSFAKHSRLIGLGIIPGELIELRRRLDNKSVVVKVKGCDIALSPEIASNIMVERCITK